MVVAYTIWSVEIGYNYKGKRSKIERNAWGNMSAFDMKRQE